MQHNGLALGWAHSGAIVPDGVIQQSVGPLDVLFFPKGCSGSPRARLDWQLKCFETGTDFLPVAPAVQMTESSGIEIAEMYAKTLLTGLIRIQGKGQLTILASWPALTPAAPPCIDGRTWLRDRSTLKTHMAAVKRKVCTTLDQLCAGFETNTDAQHHRITRDVLVPRDALHRCLALFDATGLSRDADPLNLTMTGLWPPYRFVAPLPKMEKVTL